MLVFPEFYVLNILRLIYDKEKTINPSEYEGKRFNKNFVWNYTYLDKHTEKKHLVSKNSVIL